MRVWATLVCVLLSACVAAGPGRGGKPLAADANPITGAAIATTTLADNAPASAAIPAVKPAVRPQPRPPEPGKSPPASAEPVKAEPAREVSPAQLACVKKGGTWGKVGKAGGETCIHQTKDAGKSCKRESDCEGFCLARSGTCAPFAPLFGCNDILQDNGVRVTLCID